ncbi:hypothetical protein AB0M72_12040 [Nocardiopsis dassonvillei]|nr:hypothetical protein [Nocardiopsis dassonvillei]
MSEQPRVQASEQPIVPRPAPNPAAPREAVSRILAWADEELDE